MDYLEQAEEFLNKTNTTLKVEFKHFGPHFYDDESHRDIYTVTLERNGLAYTFNFGRSIEKSSKIMAKYASQKLLKARRSLPVPKADEYLINPEKSVPNSYDILSCLQKNDPGLFEDFCADFGYDTDSIKAKNTYESVRAEFLNLAKLFSGCELEELAEIN